MTCHPQMFTYDNWQVRVSSERKKIQLLLMSLELWLAFGAFVQYHFGNMITPIYRLVFSLSRVTSQAP